MTTITQEKQHSLCLPTDISDYLRLEFACRADVGMAVCKNHCGRATAHYFSYEDTIAVAVLILRGKSVTDAAAIVAANLVCAVPHVTGYISSKVGAPDYVYTLSYALLADGSLWEILGDVDLPHADDFIQGHETDYQGVATRNLLPSEEPLLDRVRQTVTVVRPSEEGRFIAL